MLWYRSQGCHQNETCAQSLRLNLDWIIGAYNDFPQKDKFFTPYFDVLAGGPVLREQIQKGNDLGADQGNMEGWA